MSLETKDLIAAFKRQPIPCACGVIVFVLLIFAYFRMGVVETRQAELEASDKVLSKLTNNVTFSAQLDQHLLALRETNELFASRALKVGEVARNQQFFYELEASSGVRLTELRPLPVAPPVKGAPVTFFQPLGFTISVKGSYDNLMRYLRHIEYSSIPSRVVSASMVYASTDDQTLDLTVEMLGLR